MNEAHYLTEKQGVNKSVIFEKLLKKWFLLENTEIFVI